MLFPNTSVIQPCKRGHLTGRDANGTCKQCRRDSAKARYRANPVVAAKVKAGAVKWRKLNPDKIKAKGQAYRENNPAQALLEKARERARKRGQPFAIKITDVVIPEFCPLLGIKLERGKGVGGVRASSPSLDKIIPELGYVPGNVWVISYRANMIKNDASLQELQTLAHNLAERLR